MSKKNFDKKAKNRSFLRPLLTGGYEPPSVISYFFLKYFFTCASTRCMLAFSCAILNVSSLNGLTPLIVLTPRLEGLRSFNLFLTFSLDCYRVNRLIFKLSVQVCVSIFKRFTVKNNFFIVDNFKPRLDALPTERLG